jgi:hypothetical protein
MLPRWRRLGWLLEQEGGKRGWARRGFMGGYEWKGNVDGGDGGAMEEGNAEIQRRVTKVGGARGG